VAHELNLEGLIKKITVNVIGGNAKIETHASQLRLFSADRKICVDLQALTIKSISEGFKFAIGEECVAGENTYKTYHFLQSEKISV